MFALIENGSVTQYPYSVTDLKKAKPNVSFPRQPSDELLKQHGMERVFFATPPELTDTQALVEGTPVIADDRWTQVWSVREMTEDEISSRNEGQAASVRLERNALLTSSDWTQVADAPVDKTLWAAYRQALRDISTQDGFPWSVQWPTQPE